MITESKFECARDGLIIRGSEFRAEGTAKDRPAAGRTSADTAVSAGAAADRFAAGEVGTAAAASSERRPALILSHGYLANRSMCKDYAKLAAEMGYAAFTFDFNGGGLGSKSSGRSVDMTVMTEVADLKAVIAYVRSRDDVDGDRVSLLGCSQGGVVSAITARDKDLRVERLLLLYPALCIPDDARAGSMMFAHFDPQNIPDVIQRLPMELGGNYARCVIDWQLPDIVGGYDGPVLLLHGTADKIVNVTYAREAVNFYQKAEYHEIEGGEHGFRGKHEQEARKYIREFLK